MYSKNWSTITTRATRSLLLLFTACYISDGRILTAKCLLFLTSLVTFHVMWVSDHVYNVRFSIDFLVVQHITACSRRRKQRSVARQRIRGGMMDKEGRWDKLARGKEALDSVIRNDRLDMPAYVLQFIQCRLDTFKQGAWLCGLVDWCSWLRACEKTNLYQVPSKAEKAEFCRTQVENHEGHNVMWWLFGIFCSQERNYKLTKRNSTAFEKSIKKKTALKELAVTRLTRLQCAPAVT